MEKRIWEMLRVTDLRRDLYLQVLIGGAVAVISDEQLVQSSGIKEVGLIRARSL